MAATVLLLLLVFVPLLRNSISQARGVGGVGVLTDGVTRWIIVDWDGVPTWGPRGTHRFEVWIETAATGEGITYEYGKIGDGGSSDGLTVGAENRDGSSAASLTGLPVVGTEYAVTTTGPTAGGSVAIDYDASSSKEGVFSSVASLTSDITPGVTQQVQTLTVTK